MTAPTLQQTGSTGTQTQSGGFWSGLLSQALGAAAQGGMAAMTGGGSLAASAPGAASGGAGLA